MWCMWRLMYARFLIASGGNRCFSRTHPIPSAYCLMNNHYHLLIRSRTPFSKTMMLLNRRYSDYYKKKYRYTGHLYENRYYSDMVLTAQGILEVSRYIHQNPVRTKTPLVIELEHYPYSSLAFNIILRLKKPRLFKSRRTCTAFST